VLTMEYRLETYEGKLLWMRNRSKVFERDAFGKVTHILSILQNVTEEVELREELKRRSQFAETILDVSTNRITVFDREYKFVAWNKRCEELHGVPKEKVIGKTIFEMFPGIEHYPVFMDAQEQALNGKYVHIPVVRDDYSGKHLELFYVPLKNESGETYAVVNIMHDVSNYVRNSEELEALNKKLEAKNIELEQKNEEITGFAFVASHDMKEPLRKIHTFADWLIETEKEWLSPQGKTILEKMDASVKRMEQLIDDILVLTKIHSDHLKEDDVDLNKVLKDVKDEMSDKIQQTSTIIEAKKLPVIKGNRHQVFYLFQNMVSNAIKFQKPGTVPHITITSEVVSGSEVPINEPKEEYLKISFADNGFGFDQRYAKKIFQVFQRLHGKQEFEGTGIGLAICKKIMENHQGLITVESEPGKGSVFNCFFPLH
jgi:PAS domain S-box-containing protein